jgi:putative ABC transport system ATP-binding protein
MRVLEACDLYRFYHTEEEETLALRGVSLHVDAGETVVVMGPSGSGKSTLLACLAGLDEPDGGYVKLLGERLTRRSETARAGRRATDIGIVLQSGNLLEHLSIEDNVRLKMWLAHKVDERRLLELLDLVELAHRRKAYPSQVSGGEATRAAIAVALATTPPLLLADEPTGEVDAETERRVIRLFETYRARGGAALIATHSDNLAAHANRVVRLLDGRIMNRV